MNFVQECFDLLRGCCGRDHMVVGFTTTYAISTYHHSWQGVPNTILYDKVYQLLAAGLCFFPGTLVSSTNKTYRHDKTELFKVALNTITLTLAMLHHGHHLPFFLYGPSINLQKRCFVAISSSLIKNQYLYMYFHIFFYLKGLVSS